MNRTAKLILVFIAIVQALTSIAFAFQFEFITQLWLQALPNTTSLLFLLVSSIFAAAAASTLFCVLSNEPGALAGIGLDYLTIMSAMSILFLQLADGSSARTVFAILCGFGVLMGLGFFGYGLRQPIRDTRPQPMPVRIAFVIFVVALILVGGSMTLKVPGVIPWTVTPEGGVVYGWMFLGAAAYFIYALLRPSWGNTGGQLAGFLAYDVVLVVPFITRFGSEIPPQFMVGHIVYTVVVVSSGLLAIYYLFLNRSTRPSASSL